jgi:hypothetical protein
VGLSLARAGFAVLLLLFAGCGGRVERGDGSLDDAGSQSSSDPIDPLPDCVLGPPVGTVAPCPYSVKGRCYDKKLRACACACPSDHVSVCTSDYPSADAAPVEVTCF